MKTKPFSETEAGKDIIAHFLTHRFDDPESEDSQDKYMLVIQRMLDKAHAAGVAEELFKDKEARKFSWVQNLINEQRKDEASNHHWLDDDNIECPDCKYIREQVRKQARQQEKIDTFKSCLSLVEGSVLLVERDFAKDGVGVLRYLQKELKSRLNQEVSGKRDSLQTPNRVSGCESTMGVPPKRDNQEAKK